MMKFKLRKMILLAGIPALTISGTAGQAQSAEDNFTVGVEVEIAAAGAVVSGLEDITVEFDGTGGSGQIYEKNQNFCIFSPTQFFNMTIQGATKGSDTTGFYVEDGAQTNAALKFLRYNFRVYEIFSGKNDPIGSSPLGLFQNNVVETSIDSNNFNTDATCSDGENLELRFSVVLTGDPENGPVVSQLVDGQVHSYSDAVTVILDPAI